MVADPQVFALQQKLAAVRAEASRQRTADFVDYTPVVCGLPLRPLTLRTYTLLQAWGNAFVCGGPVTLKSIVQFVWLHQPEFAQFSGVEKRRVTRHVYQALRPRFPTFNSLCLFFRGVPRLSWLRHFIRPTAAELHAAAVTEIRRLVHEALRDFPRAGDDAEPAVCALTPQLVSLLIRSYSVDFVTACRLVEQLPMKQLVQFIREATYRASKGQDKLISPEEAQIWSDYLGYKTELAQAARARSSSPSS